MPFSGSGDPGLPANVKALPEARKAQWVSVFASVLTQGGSEAEAFRKANGVALEADDLITRDIPDVDILAVGVWNEIDFTAEKFDQMVEAHQATVGVRDVPLKLGHDDGQRLVQDSGYPAAGWIENLRRVGERLVADFMRVPAKVADLIDAGGFRKRSSEINFDIGIGGREWPTVLVGVALLGEDIPAVESLDDIHGLYTRYSLDCDEDAKVVVFGPSGHRKRNKKSIESLTERHLPHHKGKNNFEASTLRLSIAGLSAVKAPVALKRRMLTHLETHARWGMMKVDHEVRLAKEGLVVDEKLRKLLGLEEDDDILEAVQGLATLSAKLGEILKIGDGDDLLEKVTELSKRPEPGEGNPPKGDPKTDPKPAPKPGDEPKGIADLRAELAETQKTVLGLQGTQSRTQAESVVDNAIKEGRLVPAQREIAVKLALSDEAGFTKFVEGQPKGLIPDGERGTPDGAGGTEVDLAALEPSAAEVQAAKDLGVWSPDHRISLMKEKAKDKGMTLPADFGEKKEEK